ncbi:MAG: PAS domain-containing protein [Dechloromonas sp.]|uniref:PAS domain-containing protein n=1 Tax=Candidatus Dechloromonas phosphorivorans TaxID=2899244 RepID=A0A935MVY3_9RHOO|nr:PAS domain-containing protein [Candidatus Dechloromonas phosphorivorans]
MIAKTILPDMQIRLQLSDPICWRSVSDSIHALLGYSANDIQQGRVTFSSVIHPDDKDIATVIFSSGLEEASGDFNFRMRQASGRIRCLKGHYEKHEIRSVIA